MKRFSKDSILLLIASLLNVYSFGQLACETTKDPYAVKLVYTDLDNYISVLDKLPFADDSLSLFQSIYFDKASPALKEHIREKGFSSTTFLDAYNKNPKKYESLRKLKPQLKTQESSVYKAFENLSEIIPGTQYIPVYYMVGVLGDFFAEPSPYGLMITISALPEEPGLLKSALVHETVHVQQALTIGMED